MTKRPPRSAVLLALLLLLQTFAPLAGTAVPTATPRVVNGVLDLRNWDFPTGGSVSLVGTWRFYPGQLQPTEPLTGTGEILPVPGIWGDRLSPTGEKGFGFGTYVLEVLLPPTHAQLGLRLSTISSAYELHTDSGFVVGSGSVGSSKVESEPGYSVDLVPLQISGPRVNMRVLVSNFDHARGGIWDDIWIGELSQLAREQSQTRDLNLFLAITAFVIGLYHILLWLLRREDYSPLFFSLLCATLAVRTLSTNEVYLLRLMPDLSYLAHARVEYGSMVALLAFSALFLWNIFREDFKTRYLTLLLAPLAIYFFQILLTPSEVFSAYLYLFHGIVLVAMTICTIVVFQAVRRGRNGARLYALSIGLFIVFVLHDMSTTIFPSLKVIWASDHLLPLGFVAILLAQAGVLARRSVTAMQQLEARTAQLSEAQRSLDSHARELENRVAERTAALEEANTQLDRLARVDGLTRLANRREFDEQLARAWADHMRRGAVLSLVLLDADHFKAYNDLYGHVSGDAALVAVSDALTSSVGRPNDLVARYGGEEFVVLLPNTDIEGAYRIAEHMRSQVAALEIAHEKNAGGTLTVSLGVAAMTPGRGSDRGSLVEAADGALYLAKSTGRNQVRAAA